MISFTVLSASSFSSGLRGCASSHASNTLRRIRIFVPTRTAGRGLAPRCSHSRIVRSETQAYDRRAFRSIHSGDGPFCRFFNSTCDPEARVIPPTYSSRQRYLQITASTSVSASICSLRRESNDSVCCRSRRGILGGTCAMNSLPIHDCQRAPSSCESMNSYSVRFVLTELTSPPRQVLSKALSTGTAQVRQTSHNYRSGDGRGAPSFTCDVRNFPGW